MVNHSSMQQLFKLVLGSIRSLSTLKLRELNCMKLRFPLYSEANINFFPLSAPLMLVHVRRRKLDVKCKYQCSITNVEIVKR